MPKIALDVPDEVLLTLKFPGTDLESGLKTELAIHLYREGLLTEANACRLAGIPRLAFDALLCQLKIPIHGDVADLNRDLQGYDEWKQERNGCQ